MFNTGNKEINNNEAILGTTRPATVQSGVHLITLTDVFIQDTKAGGKSVTVRGESGEGASFEVTLFTVNSKTNTIYFKRKDGSEALMGGFKVINNIALCATGKGILDLKTENTVIPDVYNYEKGVSEDTVLPAITELKGKKITIGGIVTMEDRYKDPTKYTVFFEIVHVGTETGHTLQELTKDQEATTINNWGKTIKEGYVNDKRKQSANNRNTTTTGGDAQPTPSPVSTFDDDVPF